ncbi:hypothetical protein [Asticcacaulis sp. AND118]|uniref:hypothetical protein n=1 Tax=Asticcacaulis sp. AND118 TaxID=2840468 RepID=UPI001CFFB50C|nr:hypothetical protein [Asticcacaulis sp. AND118]UDF03015.1 hypothetical protein LH365_11310 [Asticcacaulis sp. AND118]
MPGFDGLHRIMAQLIAEADPKAVLVLGGGGGLETRPLSALCPRQPVGLSSAEISA